MWIILLYVATLQETYQGQWWSIFSTHLPHKKGEIVLKGRKTGGGGHFINGFSLHVTCRAVMTAVRLDDLTAVTVTDCCIALTQQLEDGSNTEVRLDTLRLDTLARRTSGSCAGVQRQTGGSSPQDLLLGLWPFLLLISLFLSFGQAELQQD